LEAKLLTSGPNTAARVDDATDARPACGPASLRLERSIVLVGLMGAGKSCIGRRLGQRLGLPFTDADSEIETAAGLSIAEIFSRYGEAAFRDCERRVMTRLLQGPPRVLSTGGGAFMDADTRRLIKEHAISVWLRADLDTLIARTRGRSHRPLLASGDPRAILADLMERRYPVYAEADVVVETGADNPNVTCGRVIEALEGFIATGPRLGI
jgi:shikimate kinase